MEDQIPFSLYLWTRIAQLGTRSIMGVPGDMNLELLDYINQVPGLKWIGNANELGAAYAADGYARVRDCPGVLSTTMGVGELSAINGIAGAYTEQVKLVHIVGTTTRATQKARPMIHHCLGPDPDHKVFEKISAHVRCAHAWIEDEETATAEVDRVLRECMRQSLPVYIFVPMDMVHIRVSATPLQREIDWSDSIDSNAESSVLKHIIDELSRAQRPVLLVDLLTRHHGAKREVQALADALAIDSYTTPYGKSVLDESRPNFRGVYNGEVSLEGIQHAVESSDLILNVGPLLSDSNTGGHTRKIKAEQVILLYPDYCVVKGQRYDNVYLRPLLQKLLQSVPKLDRISTDTTVRKEQPPVPSEGSKDITQSWIWKRIGLYSKPGDIIIAESGTAQFGFPEAQLASGVQYITQGYFGSIGYSVPACLGAALAQRELQQHNANQQGRVILLVGDGSLQLTAQEIGTMVRHDLKPLLFVINNGGYTIERAIHGEKESYNDIAEWRHGYLLKLFGSDPTGEQSRAVRTKEELEKVLALEEYATPRAIQMLEVFMGVMDIPWQLRQQISIVNARKAAAAKGI